MTCELIILEKGSGRAWDAAPQVQSVTYTTNRTGSPGTLKFTVNAYNGLSFIEGDPVRFSVDGQLVFLGWVFTKNRDRHAIIEVTCYDQLRYLKANASYCFTGRTAGEIITEIAEDFQLTAGRLDDTGYPIPTLIMEEKSCLDIISTALQRTLLATGKLYTFFDNGGALSLREAGSMVGEGIVGTGSLLTSYQYKTDIDQQTYNSIKLARPNEATGKADIFQVMDSGNISRYGLLQFYKTVDENLNDAQVESQARAMLKYHNRRFRTLKCQALGILGLRAGQMLMMDVATLGDISLHGLVLLERVTHTFKNDLHEMDFEVQELGV
ncbi:MAG: hypothetical protein K2N78_00430 [Oscillospiraceae bacterium]|nr:hypothetical protein [Oscillospiraceae bacterium]